MFINYDNRPKIENKIEFGIFTSKKIEGILCSIKINTKKNENF